MQLIKSLCNLVALSVYYLTTTKKQRQYKRDIDIAWKAYESRKKYLSTWLK